MEKAVYITGTIFIILISIYLIWLLYNWIDSLVRLIKESLPKNVKKSVAEDLEYSSFWISSHESHYLLLEYISKNLREKGCVPSGEALRQELKKILLTEKIEDNENV